MSIQPVILAAGQGKRMFSSLPKVLQPLAGKFLIEHVIDVAKNISPDITPIVIHGHQGDVLQKYLAHENLIWIEQAEQLGTGHAVLQTLLAINKNHRVLILCGDGPLISTETLNRLINETAENAIGVVTAVLENPFGYGRIIRNKANDMIAIVEEKDTSAEQKKIQEVNSGIYLVPHKYLAEWLPKLSNHNAQHEYYLTDIISLAVKNNIHVQGVKTSHPHEIYGVNSRAQLANVERIFQKQEADKLMQQGATLFDPHRVDIRGEVKVGKDVVIDINVIFEGNVEIGSHCIIGANSILKNVVIGNHVTIKSHSLIEDAKIGHHASVGPFARIRPGTILEENTLIGNFVEVKKSHIAAGSKVNHLSYIGDSQIGEKVNVGAGTITCNYDGVNKFQTIIGDGAFIGSNSSLVAPVTIEEGATIAAGSTIVSNAPKNQLTIARARQTTVTNWQRPKKNEL